MIGTLWSLAMGGLYAVVFVRLFWLSGASGKLLGGLGLGQALFLSVLGLVFQTGWLLPESISGGAYYLTVLVSVGVSLSLLYASAGSRFQSIPQAPLQLAQGFRVIIGAGFLMFGVIGLIPGWFSIMDAALHIGSGLLGLWAAYAVAVRSPHRRRLLWLANGLGIADILIIVTTIAFVVWQDLGPRHPMHIVVFGVGPILLWIHLVSVIKLVREP